MFREERSSYRFSWKDLGDIDKGRPNLGSSTSVAVYRLMQYTLRDVLITRYGVEAADRAFYEAGRLAGAEFYKNTIEPGLGFDAFISRLDEELIRQNIGILRVEKADLNKMEFILTVSEDLDCSGLPPSGETVCTYDEGFIAGILYAYIAMDFLVKEVDCWAMGERTCRFSVRPSG